MIDVEWYYRNEFKVVGCFVVVVMCGCVLFLWLFLGPSPGQKRVKIGASFTISHAMWLNGSWGGPKGDGTAVGPEWQRSLKEIVYAGFEPIRLSHPWDLLEPEQGKFNWRDLDEAVDICEKAGVDVVLCLGVKSPRYPEYHPPGWIKDKVMAPVKPKDDEDSLRRLIKLPPEINLLKGIVSETVLAYSEHSRDAIDNFLTEAVRRYRDRKCIKWWQIENEPLMFSQSLAVSRVKEEIGLVRALDQKYRPVMITTHCAVDVLPDLAQYWTPAIERIIPLGDIVGFDVYYSSHRFHIEPEGHFRLIDKWIATARKRGKKVWIAEWQAEPWEKDQKMDFANPLGNASLTPSDYEVRFREWALGRKADAILLWGLEFQLACRKQGNSVWWDTSRRILRNYGK